LLVDEPIRLGASDVPGGRPFAHPDRTADDLVSILEMTRTLRRILTGPSTSAARSRPYTLQAGNEVAPHRVIICDDAALRMESAPSFVGFFALKRPGLDHAPLTRVDDQLVLEFPRHPGILSYSSIALPDGNWGNLIVLRSVADGERWREGERHAWAVRELAPAHYSSVRLHQGRVPGGVLSGLEPVLLRTRYFDYATSSPWRAERVVAGD